MKLRELIEAESDNFQKAVQWISVNYNEKKVAAMLDDEIPNWIDSDWEDDGVEDEYDWYDEYGNKEAEDAITELIIKNTETKLKVKFPYKEHIKIDHWIRDKYDFL